MPGLSQHDLDHYRKLAAYVEETIARDEAALPDLPDSVAREISARLEWRRRELAAVLETLGQMEADVFAMSVKRDIRDL
jgi:hypothetical protein